MVFCQQGVQRENGKGLRSRLENPITQAMTGQESLDIIATFGRTKAEVARLLGISPVALQKWKQGGRPSHGTETLLLLLSERPELLDVLGKMRERK